MSERIISLKELIDTMDNHWLRVTPLRKIRMAKEGVFLTKDDVSVSFKQRKSDVPVDRVLVRIGYEVANTLGWKVGDKLVLFSHPDDKLAFKICKTEAGDGNKLSKDPGSRHLRVIFRWTDSFPLQKTNGIIVYHYCPRDEYLLFNARELKKNKGVQ